MSKDRINNKIAKNFLWSFAEKFGAQFVSLIVSFVLAKVLGPKAFGTVALIMVFINILQVLVDAGFGTALIQKKETDETDFSTVFFFNLIFCIIFYFLVYAFAPTIAYFFEDNTLIKYIRVLALSIIIYGFKNIQYSYVSKHLMFRKFFFSTIGGTIFSAIVGIYMAYHGFGIWSIIAQYLTNACIDTIVLWITVGWYPSFKFSYKRLKTLFSYGGKILSANILDVFYNEFKNLMIGKMFSTTNLGYFNRGEIIPRTIVVNTDKSIDSVLFPVLSNYQNDEDGIRQFVRNAITTSVFFLAPMMIGLFAIAPNAVRIILSEEWLPCVPYLRVYCVTFMFYPIHTANLNSIKALGRSDLFFKLEVYKVSVCLALLLFSIRYGLMMIAYSLIISSFLCQAINAWPNRKLIGYGYIQQFRDISPYLLASMIMGLGVYFLSYIDLDYRIIMIIQLFTGVFLYTIIMYLMKSEVFLNLVKFLKR